MKNSSTNERESKVAPCGIDCGNCELFLSRDNAGLMNYLLSRGIPQEKLPCDGCRAIEGACPVIGGICETYRCVGSHAVEFCFECGEYPCSKLQPASDRADVLPHNLKVFNLSYIERFGVAAFVKESAAIKERYYKGKMRVGEGPQVISTKEG